MDDQSPEKVKEYSNLNNYYLKISLTEQNFRLIVLNTENLDNSLYQFIITEEEFEKNSNKYNNKSLTELYDKTIELIEKGKYLFNDNKESISLSLFKGEKFDINKDIKFSLNKSNAKQRETYMNALITIIKNLKTECNNIENKIEELQLNKQINNEKNQNLKEGNGEIQDKYIKSLEQYIREIKLKKRRRMIITSAPPNLNNENYPMIEIKPTFFNIISGFGENSYNVVKKNYDENRIKIITDYKLDKPVKIKSGEAINPKINYFAIYDGHGGEKCFNFLNENLHKYIFSSEYFPLYTIQAIDKAYIEVENSFFETVVDSESGKLLDSSGSCAISTLIMNEFCFVTNLGNSRALYSFDSGKKFFQVTRDHLPNDPIEKNRIEKAGGKIIPGNIAVRK